jgi:hypothetical protein
MVGPSGEEVQGRVLMSLGGALLIALPSVLTVAVDRARGMLSLRYRSLVRISTKEYPVNEISFVNVAQDREGERMYRLELILGSGQVIPLRSFYSVGKRHYERRALRLRAALQVSETCARTSRPMRSISASDNDS